VFADEFVESWFFVDEGFSIVLLRAERLDQAIVGGHED
jgi:hypothetical protein